MNALYRLKKSGTLYGLNLNIPMKAYISLYECINNENITNILIYNHVIYNSSLDMFEFYDDGLRVMVISGSNCAVFESNSICVTDSSQKKVLCRIWGRR